MFVLIVPPPALLANVIVLLVALPAARSLLMCNRTLPVLASVLDQLDKVSVISAPTVNS